MTHLHCVAKLHHRKDSLPCVHGGLKWLNGEIIEQALDKCFSDGDSVSLLVPPPGQFIRGRGRIYLSSTSGMLMLHHTKITHIIVCLLWIGFSELVLREHWKARILSGQWSVPKENVKVGLYGKASAPPTSELQGVDSPSRTLPNKAGHKC